MKWISCRFLYKGILFILGSQLSQEILFLSYPSILPKSVRPPTSFSSCMPFALQSNFVKLRLWEAYSHSGMLKNVPKFSEIREPIMVFKIAGHLCLSLARWIQSTLAAPYKIHPTFIIYCGLMFLTSKWSLLSDFPTNLHVFHMLCYPMFSC
jgi:hypothetical protein